MNNILVAVDYVSKWVDAVEHPNNEVQSVTTFLKKNIFLNLVLIMLLLVMEGQISIIGYLSLCSINMV